MVTAILGILDSVLHIWAKKLDRKYIDKLAELKRAWYEENNKPRDQQSDAILDNIKFELRIISSAIAADLRIANPEN